MSRVNTLQDLKDQGSSEQRGAQKTAHPSGPGRTLAGTTEQTSTQGAALGETHPGQQNGSESCNNTTNNNTNNITDNTGNIFGTGASNVFSGFTFNGGPASGPQPQKT